MELMGQLCGILFLIGPASFLIITYKIAKARDASQPAQSTT